MTQLAPPTLHCPLCDGSCVKGDVSKWLVPELSWLWHTVAHVGDARLDLSLTEGTFYVKAPSQPFPYAEDLLGADLAPGQSRKVQFSVMAAALAPLTPGAVAAHAENRQIAEKKRAKALRYRRVLDLRERLAHLFDFTPAEWTSFSNLGWPSRVDELMEGDVLDQVAAVCAALPADPADLVDRRVLAQRVLGNPHALDRRRLVSTLALVMLRIKGRADSNCSPREAWRQTGVLMDGIHDGIAVAGIAPLGVTLAPGITVTVPPRVLALATWPAGDGVVFVTENPSILEAALDVPGALVVCTLGTPTKEAVGALARLAEAGWELRVRADFDATGLSHVASILAATPTAVPWRMSAKDYLDALSADRAESVQRYSRPMQSPWDPDLAKVMTRENRVVNEEALMDLLLLDIEVAAASA